MTRNWCDRPWTLGFNEGDKEHLLNLARHNHPMFLVVHAFYCIHDWRRMGETTEPDKENQLDSPITVPAVDSLIRTVIFELTSAKQAIEEHPIDSVKVRHRPVEIGDTHAARLSSLSKKDHYHIELNGQQLTNGKEAIRPIAMTEFLSRLDEYWDCTWTHSTWYVKNAGRAKADK